MSDCSKHVPVLLHETIKYLNLNDTGIYVDATLGMGGYSSEILKHSNCRLISIDRDPEAISNSHSLKRKFGVRFTVVNDLFSNLEKILKNLNIDKINGIAFDFGVSSPQIDNPNRGFSFRFDGPLDMRMGGSTLSAADFINNNERKTITNIYGPGQKQGTSGKGAQGLPDGQGKPDAFLAEYEAMVSDVHNEAADQKGFRQTNVS